MDSQAQPLTHCLGPVATTSGQEIDGVDGTTIPGGQDCPWVPQPWEIPISPMLVLPVTLLVLVEGVT